MSHSKIARRGLIALAIIVVAGCAFADSDPPVPSTGQIIGNPQKHTTKTNKKSNDDQRGTKKTPLEVDIVKTPIDEERADQQTKDSHQAAADNGHLLVVTGMLAGFACLQWLVMLCQSWQLRRSVDIADRALTDLETPFVYPLINGSDIGSKFFYFRRYDHETSGSSGASAVHPKIQFTLMNYGRTPALLRSFIAEVTTGNIPPSLSKESTPDYAVDYVLAPNTGLSRNVTRTIIHPIDKILHKEIITDKIHIFLHGKIVFDDIFGFNYTQIFCIAYDCSTKSFMPWGEGHNKRERRKIKKTPHRRNFILNYIRKSSS